MRISDWSSDVCSSDLHGLHEAAVDLQMFYREAGQVMQVGKAGAKVVHGEADAALLEQGKCLAQDVGVAHQRRLGEFELQTLRVPAGSRADAQYALGKVGVAQLSRREIDGKDRKSVVWGRRG